MRRQRGTVRSVAMTLVKKGWSTERILFILRREMPTARPSAAMVDRLRAVRRAAK